jgi:hypothetical protein
MLALANFNKLMGFYKVAYWLKSGPFLGRQSIEADMGQAPTFSADSEENINSFEFGLNSLITVSVILSKSVGFYKVAYWLKSGPFLAENRSRPIRGLAPNISWQFGGKKNPPNLSKNR